MADEYILLHPTELKGKGITDEKQSDNNQT